MAPRRRPRPGGRIDGSHGPGRDHARSAVRRRRVRATRLAVAALEDARAQLLIAHRDTPRLTLEAVAASPSVYLRWTTSRFPLATRSARAASTRPISASGPAGAAVRRRRSDALRREGIRARARSG